MDTAYYINQSTRYIRLLMIIFILLGIIMIGDYWLRGELGKIEELLMSAKDQMGIGMLILGGMLYLLLLSIPFVPGVELGLLLMCLFGREGIVFVYFCTIGALLLSFTVGRCVPNRCMTCWLQRLGVAEISQTSAVDWEQCMLKHSKIGQKLLGRFGSSLLQYRYLVLGILFNLPGNSVLGGGGGIALMCGVSRLFKWQWFLATVILVTAPVPLLAFLGLIQLETFF